MGRVVDDFFENISVVSSVFRFRICCGLDLSVLGCVVFTGVIVDGFAWGVNDTFFALISEIVFLSLDLIVVLLV